MFKAMDFVVLIPVSCTCTGPLQAILLKSHIPMTIMYVCGGVGGSNIADGLNLVPPLPAYI